MKIKKARITSLGSYLPKRVLTNQELEQMVKTSDDWIVSRTGIRERRIAAPDEAASHMGSQAATEALKKAGIEATQLDLILCCTMTPDYLCPSTAALIQHQLSAASIPAMDLQAACTGFLYGLSVAKAYIESGQAECILVVATEKMSSVVDFQDRNTCVLFGDGACAAIIQGEGKGLLIDTMTLGADGEQAEIITIPAGGSRCPTSKETVEAKQHYFQMAGREVFKHAVRRMAQAAKSCLDKAGLTEEDVDWLVPHQANLRILEALSKQFDIPREKIVQTLHKYGNTSASSVAIALEELLEEHTLQEGDRLLLVAFGAGLTWGATLLTVA